tara:strand:+ start:9727 stop:9918 length:192 start_codon:yes stop_codon:yes gene_type:complete
MSKKNYNTIINTIQKIRSKNNKNWMDLLRLAFKHAPNQSSKIMKRINSADKQISKYLNKLEKK